MNGRRYLQCCLLGLMFSCQAEETAQLQQEIQQLRVQLQQFDHSPSGEKAKKSGNTTSGLTRSIQHIGLLLPLSGHFGAQAEHIRQGFYHAWERDKTPTKPKLSILDTRLDPSRIYQHYQHALSLGADFIVGPLHKEAIQRLSLHPLQTPILALNIIDQDGVLSPNMWQMGLSPEQEIRQILQALRTQKHRHLLVLLAANEQGDRLQEVIETHWADAQHTLSLARYAVQDYDLDLAIQHLLRTDRSLQRIAQLHRLFSSAG